MYALADSHGVSPDADLHAFRDRLVVSIADAIKYDEFPKTQVPQAARFGVSQPVLNDWLNARGWPAMGTARRVAIVLKVCVDWLLTARGPQHPPNHFDEMTRDETALLNGYRALNPSARKSVLDIVERLCVPVGDTSARPRALTPAARKSKRH